MRTSRRLSICTCLLVLSLVMAASTAAAQGSEASRAFAEGTKLFDSGDYLGAVEAFRRAYQLKPHFSVLCNIGMSQERLGDVVAAAQSFRDCLSQGAGSGPNADAVRKLLDRVEARITKVQVRSRGDGIVFVDGREAGRAPQQVAVNPGSHVVEVRRSGAEPARRTVNTRGGEQLDLELTPIVTAPPKPSEPQIPAKPRRRHLHQAWFWSGVALTVGFAAAAAALGAMTLSTRDDYEANPTRELYDRGVNYRLLTNVFWGLTAAGAATSTVLFFYTDFGRRERAGRTGGGELMIGLQRSF